MWLGWSQVTWAANAVAGNSRVARLIFLVATATSVPMAASISTAFDDSGLLFAIPIVIITLMGVALVIVAAQGMEEATASARRYAGSIVVVSMVLIVGATLPEGPRIAAWAAGIVVFAIGTWRTSSGEWTMRAGHFAERHGLIIIVALGEVIVVVGKPLVDSLEEGESFSAESIIALSAAGVFACLLWWAYFDRVQPALEHRVEELTGPDKARLARDGYTYWHLPIVAGVIVGAAALEEITLHPSDTLPLAFRLMLFGGLAAFLGGIGGAAWRTFRIIARERLVGVAAIGLLIFFGKAFDGVWIIVGLNVIFAAVLIVEHFRVEGPRTPAA